MLHALVNPNRLFSRDEVLAKPSPVPSESGVYAWYFRNYPKSIPGDGCISIDGATLLYIGISPDKASKPNSTQNLRKRIYTHYRGNAEGSTLRRTLGVLLASKSGYPLRRVGSGRRMTFTHRGERWLDQWMAEHAFVCWAPHLAPWVAEDELLGEVSLPLNIKGNLHPFAKELRSMRIAATKSARATPIATEESDSRSGF